MQTLLCRPPTDCEKALQAALQRRDPQWVQTGFPPRLWQDLPSPNLFFAAVLSLIELPPDSRPARALCQALLASPGFLRYLASPASFSRAQLATVCRTLMRVDPGLDARLASALPGNSCAQPDVDATLHALPVLDELTPGARLVMALTRLTRSPSAVVASKATLMLGRRVSNPPWAERQMSVDDPRIRANVIQSLWGLDSATARKCLHGSLHDPNNRVVANALVGLHLIGDSDVGARLKAMVTHPDPRFRASAAWAMGRICDRSFTDSLTLALEDSDAQVRASAARALEALTADS